MSFFAKQQAYDKNWSLCNTLVERNLSIKEECEGIIQEYAQLVRGAEGVLKNEGFGNNKLVDDNLGMPVLRLRCNYRMRITTEVMEEVFGFEKIERGLPYIVGQASIFLEEIIICNMKWRYDVGVDVKECYTVSIKQVKVFWGIW